MFFIDFNICIMICTNCNFWKDNKCTDEVNYVDENGDDVCRYNPGAILSNREQLCQEPAFPCEEIGYVNEDKPCNLIQSHIGMSKRFYAACAAMQGILSNPNPDMISLKTENVIEFSYLMADELLKQENE